MLYLTKEIINNASVFNNLITTEKDYLNSIIKIKNIQKETIFNYMQKFGNAHEYINQEHDGVIQEFLNNLKKYVNVVEDDFVLLNNMKMDIDNLQRNPFNVDLEDFNKKISYTTSLIMDNIAEVEVFLNNILNNFFGFRFDMSNSNMEESNTQFENEDIQDYSSNYGIIPENTLLVSETKGFVYLPYTETQMKQLETNNPGLSRFKLINKYFRKNYKVFKNSSISRFRETFNLVRNKEKGSILQAFDLGFELFFNYNLHPAVIASCKNLNELDTYLGCLENGKTSDFKYFNIIFEIAPMVAK